jgi:hypothetical protein
MPIEIRELVIRATVDPAAGGDGASGNCGMPPDKDKARGGAAGGETVDAGGDLVQACVREVMRILERQAER